MIDTLEKKIELENQIICDNCGSTDIITDEERGETICRQCGFVVEEKMIDYGSEWRAYNQEEQNKRSRTETTSYKINNDLSTYISLENRDALGKVLSPDKKAQFFRMRRWQVRIKNQESKERNLNKANQELDRICSQLDVPLNIKITAGQLYKKSFEAGATKGYPIDSMIAAAVYAAARIRRVPRTLDEVSDATQISKKRVAQLYRILVKRMNFKIPHSKPADFIIRIGTETGMSSTSQQLAVKILNTATEKKLTLGKDPSGLAAAGLYLAGVLKSERVNQSLIAKAAHVTEVTIRHNYKDLVNNLNPTLNFR